MGTIFNLFKSAPNIEEIQGSDEVKADYKYWRMRIFYSMFMGYALFYFTRKSFTFAMPGLIQDLGFDKSQLGILASILSLSYGLSKFVSGVLADRANARYFMAIGLMITGVCNIFFGLSSSLLMFALFWGLNGWFQGCGWPPCARLLTHWYSQNERGRWWAAWNVSHNIGGFLIPIIAAVCIQYFGWRYAMYVPGVICILGGFVLMNRLRDTPQSLGLPPIEKFRNDYSGIGTVANEDKLSAKELLFEYVLKNKFIWLLAISYFFVQVVRTGINDWCSLYLQETKAYGTLSANTCVSLFEVGGFFGSLTAGWASDKLFGGRRGPINVLFTAGIVGAVIFFWLTPLGHMYMDSLSLFLIGFLIFGPQMLIGMAAAELSPKKAAATASGFAGCFAYIGAATAGYPLAKITQEWGWDGFFWAIAICCLVATVLLIPLWSVQQVRTAKVKLETADAAQA